jgi:small-conductance mechanosensitive channel
LIIYLNHSVKIGDSITIIDKDYEIDGTVSSIGLFFLTLKSNSGDQITVPSNLFVQKMIRINGSQAASNEWKK